MDMRLKLVGRALTGQGKDQAMMQGHSHSCPPRIYFLIGPVGFPLGKFCTGRFMLAFFSYWMAPEKSLVLCFVVFLSCWPDSTSLENTL
jgi:hypothetical protein